MIRIDGSQGEGGGQILRTSLALSAYSGKPFQIDNIRSKRKKPGLMRQHLSCVHALQLICSARMEGDEISSQSLTFVPGQVRSGQYHFAVGTAGSAMLVLQTLLPPLMMAGGKSTVILEGGTHNPLSPTFHYIDEVFLPLLRRIGGNYAGSIERWGFFPAGGGRVVFEIEPSTAGLTRLELCRPGGFKGASVLAAVARIPRQIAEDENCAIIKAAEFEISQKMTLAVDSPGPGNVAMLRLDYEHGSAMFTGFGELGVSRSRIAAIVFGEANRFFRAKAAVDHYLADQILVPMALAGGGSFTTTRPTAHTMTNMKVIENFLPVRFVCEQQSEKIWKIGIAAQSV